MNLDRCENLAFFGEMIGWRRIVESSCSFERKNPATSVSVLVQYMRGWGGKIVRMGDSGSDGGG
jgi:hypothetical protein